MDKGDVEFGAGGAEEGEGFKRPMEIGVGVGTAEVELRMGVTVVGAEVEAEVGRGDLEEAGLTEAEVVAAGTGVEAAFALEAATPAEPCLLSSLYSVSLAS